MLKGGISGRSAKGKRIHTRPFTALTLTLRRSGCCSSGLSLPPLAAAQPRIVGDGGNAAEEPALIQPLP